MLNFAESSRKFVSSARGAAALSVPVSVGPLVRQFRAEPQVFEVRAMVELLSMAPLFEYRTRLRNSRSCSLLLVCAIVVASSGCAQVQPSPSSDPIKRLDNIMDSSAYFFPRPQPNGSDAYGAAFVRNPSVIKGNELPAIQGAQSYGKRMLEGLQRRGTAPKAMTRVQRRLVKSS